MRHPHRPLACALSVAIALAGAAVQSHVAAAAPGAPKSASPAPKSPSPHPANAASPATARLPRIALFRDPAFAAPDLADVAGEALSGTGLGVDVLTVEGMCAKGRLTPANDQLLVFPSDAAGRCPAAVAGVVQSYLSAGGRIMFVGGPPLQAVAWPVAGRWVTAADLPSLLQPASERHDLIPLVATGTPKGWSHSADWSAPSSLSLDAVAGEPALKVAVKGFRSWDTFAHSAKAADQLDDTVCFWAAGDSTTPDISVEVREHDGSRWIATVPVTTSWAFHAVPSALFRFWADGSPQTRGNAGDSLRVGGMSQIVVGLSRTHSSAGDGDHTFWLSAISTARSPLPPGSGAEPVIDTVTPAYKLFPVHAGKGVRASPGQAIASPAAYPLPTGVFSCSPRPQGSGFGKGRPSRFVPILDTYDEAGLRNGYAAWAVLCGGQAPDSDGATVDSAVGRYPGAAWAVFGVTDVDWYRSVPVQAALVSTAKHLLGEWLYEGGSEFYTYQGTEAKVHLGSSAWQGAPAAGCTVRVRVLASGGKAVFEKQAPAPLIDAVWNLKGVPTGSYEVETTLLKGKGVVDCIEQPLTIWDPKPIAARRYVTARNGKFWVDGKEWRAHGVNYMPSSGIGLEDGQQFEHWLSAESYDPMVAEEDLSRIAAMGLNAVSVFVYAEDAAAMNLADLLLRCEHHGLKVNLSLRPHADPLQFDAEEVTDTLSTYGLAANDTVFAYDLAWERGWGTYEPSYQNTAGRVGYDDQWAAWVEERYGSIALAESDWGFAVPLREGDPTGPSDEMLGRDGPWRRMVAAYRRFVDDFVASAQGRAVRAIRGVDPNHLISFRMTSAGDPTESPAQWGFDFRGVGAYMDIMEPEGYGRVGSWERVKDGLFTAAYARYAAPGRPVMWAEFGTSAWAGTNWPQASRSTALVRQGQFLEDFYHLASLSDASGTMAWWFPGGFRVGENSDFGILNPDGSQRPASLAMRSWAPLLTAATEDYAPDTWIDIDRDSSVSGLPGIYTKARAAFWAAVDAGGRPALRDAGTGTTSADTPLVAVGNTPYSRSKPAKYLDADLYSVEVKDADGKWETAMGDASVEVAAGAPVLVRARAMNLQEATWLAPGGCSEPIGCVFLATLPGAGVEGSVGIASNAGFAQEASAAGSLFIAPAAKHGTRLELPVTLQLTSRGRMWFGNKVEVTLIVR